MPTYTPHDILGKLGIHVPPEGMEVAETDSLLYDTILRMAGDRLSLADVGEDEFEGLYDEMAALSARIFGGTPIPATPELVGKTRRFATNLFETTFHRPPPARDGEEGLPRSGTG